MMIRGTAGGVFKRKNEALPEKVQKGNTGGATHGKEKKDGGRVNPRGQRSSRKLEAFLALKTSLKERETERRGVTSQAASRHLCLEKNINRQKSHSKRKVKTMEAHKKKITVRGYAGNHKKGKNIPVNKGEGRPF